MQEVLFNPLIIYCNICHKNNYPSLIDGICSSCYSTLNDSQELHIDRLSPLSIFIMAGGEPKVKKLAITMIDVPYKLFMVTLQSLSQLECFSFIHDPGRCSCDSFCLNTFYNKLCDLSTLKNLKRLYWLPNHSRIVLNDLAPSCKLLVVSCRNIKDNSIFQNEFEFLHICDSTGDLQKVKAKSLCMSPPNTGKLCSLHVIRFEGHGTCNTNPIYNFPNLTSYDIISEWNSIGEYTTCLELNRFSDVSQINRIPSGLRCISMYGNITCYPTDDPFAPPDRKITIFGSFDKLLSFHIHGDDLDAKRTIITSDTFPHAQYAHIKFKNKVFKLKIVKISWRYPFLSKPDALYRPLCDGLYVPFSWIAA